LTEQAWSIKDLFYGKRRLFSHGTKNPLAAKLDSAYSLVQFWLSSELSNYFQIGQHVVLLHLRIHDIHAWGGDIWTVNFCGLYAIGLSELPTHYSLFSGQT